MEIILYPFTTLVEFFFNILFDTNRNIGISIILLSVIINTLIIPISRYSDRKRIRVSKLNQKMKPEIIEIKKKYKGEKRFNEIQKIYEKHRFSPSDPLKASLGLFIQIPFFFSVFLFLSQSVFTDLSKLTHDQSFLFLRELSTPDKLLNIGSLSINIMPFIMTFFNLSSIFFYKGSEKKTLIFMSIAFLILLYPYPSGLLLYWTTSNIYNSLSLLILHVQNKKN